MLAHARSPTATAQARACTHACERQRTARARVVAAKASNAPRDVDVMMDRRSFARSCALALVAATAAPTREARAFLGFGENKDEKYGADTKAIIAQVKSTLEMAPGTEGREESINQTRSMTNAWVAKYRRDNATTGKPSYGQVYSALNAVSGHFNNFGTKYPFPAKRKDRVFEEFAQAEILLERGR